MSNISLSSSTRTRKSKWAAANTIDIIAPYIDVNSIDTHEQIEAGIVFVKKVRQAQLVELKQRNLRDRGNQRKKNRKGGHQLERWKAGWLQGI